MRVSLNQIEQTSRKAVRGAGLAWGLADDAGKAVRWLHAYGLNGVAVLADCLDCGERLGAPTALTGVWCAPEGRLDPLVTGACLADCAGRMYGADKEVVRTDAIAYPLLAAGFLGVVADIEDLAFTLTWPSADLHCRRGEVQVGGADRAVEAAAAEFLECRQFTGPGTADVAEWRAPRIGEAVISAGGAWERLDGYARRTYVEASEASRLTGAGAGLQDND